jgi:hypothetical protein
MVAVLGVLLLQVPSAVAAIGDNIGITLIPAEPDTIPAAADTVPETGADEEAAVQPADTIPRPDLGTAPDTIPLGADTIPQERAVPRGEVARADSIFQALLRRQGYTVMEYGGDSATYHATDRVLRLFGPAEVKRGQDELIAQDTIIYREDTGHVLAYGQPKLTGDGQPIEGNVMFYDLNTRRATVLGGRTQIAEAGAQWYVRGDVTAEGNERVYATKSIFTTDDRDEPAYYFEADNIKVIRDRVLVGRPARLYFRNVPVFWLPFVFQDLTRGRRSGLLTPQFSMNDIVRTSSSGEIGGGTGRQIDNLGMYWAINDFADAQLSTGWRSGDYRSLTGSLRYRVTSQFLNGNISYRQFWQEDGGRNLQYSGSTSWQPNERTNLAVSGNYASSSRFLREISTDPLLGTQNLSSSGSLNRRFDWGSIDLGGSRNQSLSDGRIDRTFPQGSFVIRPLTFFRPESALETRWYSNSSFSLNLRGSQQVRSFSEPRPQDREQTDTRMSASPVLRIGEFDFSPSLTFDRQELSARPEIFDEVRDTVFPGLPGVLTERASWGTGFGYGIPLIGETRLTPSFSVNQELRRDTLTGGALQAGPLRQSYSASLNTTLYGFFPGFGPFNTIRHKVTPSFTYRYSPAVTLRPGQEGAFGREGFANNEISLGAINQTFEAKVRRPPEQRTAADADTLPGEVADTVNGAGAAPLEEQRVTLLSISTTGFVYDFERARQGESGLRTRTVSNTVTSEYLSGLQFNFSHELFDPRDAEPGTLGRFSPMLTSVSTNFSIGETTPILRWFFGSGREDPVMPAADADTLAPAQGEPQLGMPGSRMSGLQPAPRGPWSMDVSYTYSNYRLAESPSHDFQLRTGFSPTAHWSVSWYSTYSVGSGFGAHRLTLTRDLYRWEANFNFTRTVTGNTSFDVLVRLKDLPDLKVDYREHNIGARGQ